MAQCELLAERPRAAFDTEPPVLNSHCLQIRTKCLCVFWVQCDLLVALGDTMCCLVEVKRKKKPSFCTAVSWYGEKKEWAPLLRPRPAPRQGKVLLLQIAAKPTGTQVCRMLFKGFIFLMFIRNRGVGVHTHISLRQDSHVNKRAVPNPVVHGLDPRSSKGPAKFLEISCRYLLPLKSWLCF